MDEMRVGKVLWKPDSFVLEIVKAKDFADFWIRQCQGKRFRKKRDGS